MHLGHGLASYATDALPVRLRLGEEDSPPRQSAIENQALRQARLASALDPALFIPLDEDLEYRPSKSKASDDDKLADLTDILSVTSSTNLFRLEVALIGPWQ